MNIYRNYYYTTKKEEQGYSWTIRNKEGESLQVSEEFFDTESLAVEDCIENIQEYYY